MLLSRLNLQRGGEPGRFPELEAILSAHQSMEFYGPEAGLIGAIPAPNCVRARGETPRFQISLGDEYHHAGEGGGCYGVAGYLPFKLAAWGARWAWCQRRKTLGNVGSFTL